MRKPEKNTAVVQKITRGREIQILDFQCDRPLEFEAGQFLMLELPDGLKRAYSIASPPAADNSLQLLVGNVVIGEGTKYLCALKEGDSVTFLSPFGLLSFLEKDQDETLFIGTSTGLAPFRSIILDQLNKGHTKPLRLLYGNRYQSNMIYHDELTRLAEGHSNLTYQHILSRPEDGWTGEKGYVTDLLKKIDLKDGKKRLFYICGGQKVINDVRDYVMSQGVERADIRFESFG